MLLAVPTVPTPVRAEVPGQEELGLSAGGGEQELCEELHLLDLLLAPHGLDLLPPLRPLLLRAWPPDPGPAVCEE